MGSTVFYGCKSLRTIAIPGSVEYLEGGLFGECNLSHLSFTGESDFFTISDLFIVRKSVMQLVGVFRDVREIEIPECIEEIGSHCFVDCSLLSSVRFARGSAVKRIGKNAFSGCKNLLEIEIPASVEEIGDGSGSFSPLCRVTFESGSCFDSECHRIHTQCTFKETGKSYAPQLFYSCLTCGIVDPKGFCQACRDYCHAGHETVFAGTINGFCDCGAGVCDTPCLFMSNNA
jgi:hypothetical protein